MRLGAVRGLGIGQHEAAGRRQEAAVAHPAQDQGGEQAALGVDHQVEGAVGQRPAPDQLARAAADGGVVQHLVDQPGHQRRQAVGIDGVALAGQPGDAGRGEGGAQRADERQLDQPVADGVEADIDQDAAGIGVHPIRRAAG